MARALNLMYESGNQRFNDLINEYHRAQAATLTNSITQRELEDAGHRQIDGADGFAVEAIDRDEEEERCQRD